jgi:hypothetical protein
VILAGGLLAAAYLFRPLNHLLAKPPAARAVMAVPRGRRVVALVLALTSILLGLLSAAPYRLLQIGRPGAADEEVL